MDTLRIRIKSVLVVVTSVFSLWLLAKHFSRTEFARWRRTRKWPLQTSGFVVWQHRRHSLVLIVGTGKRAHLWLLSYYCWYYSSHQNQHRLGRVTKEVRRRRDDDKFFVRRRRECSLLVLTLDQLNGRYTNKALLMVVFACARALLSLKLQNWIFL